MNVGAALIFCVLPVDKAEGEESLTRREFGQDMGRRGHVTKKIGGHMVYSGLMVTKTEAADAGRSWS